MYKSGTSLIVMTIQAFHKTGKVNETRKCWHIIFDTLRKQGGE